MCGTVGHVHVQVNDKLRDIVIAAIEKLTGKNAVFTAFDVTRQVRQENPTMNVPHNDVRNLILDEFRSNFAENYDRTSILLQNQVEAMCYHPVDVDAYTHPFADKSQAVDTDNTDTDGGSVTGQPVTATISTTVDKEVVALTTEKRLNVSRKLMDKMGLSAGQMVEFSTNGGVMTLTKAQKSSGSVLVVNSDGRCRLGEKTLVAEFGQLHDKYEMEFSNDSIMITPKSVN